MSFYNLCIRLNKVQIINSYLFLLSSPYERKIWEIPENLNKGQHLPDIRNPKDHL
jgi:hypothetical protein